MISGECVDANRLSVLVAKLERMNKTLPTKEEYEREHSNCFNSFQNTWSEPKYICEKCGGNMRKNLMIVLTSIPVQYEYQCDKCGHVDYQYN